MSMFWMFFSSDWNKDSTVSCHFLKPLFPKDNFSFFSCCTCLVSKERMVEHFFTAFEVGSSICHSRHCIHLLAELVHCTLLFWLWFLLALLGMSLSLRFFCPV
jgi:hypothetical protein